MKRLRSLRAFALLPMISLGQSTDHPTLASLRPNYRPLLLFAASADRNFRQQLDLLASQPQKLQERQIVVVPFLAKEIEGTKPWSGIIADCHVDLLAPGESISARRRFRIGNDDFTVILIGKDGGEKLRSQTPVTMEMLTKLIDSMPMRQNEVRDGHPAKL